MKKLTEQEKFWISNGGDDYTDRNIVSRTELRAKLWKRALQKTINVKSIFEIGCNVGLNLVEINKLDSNIDLFGIEINQKAAAIARKNQFVTVINESVLSYNPDTKHDMCFTSGVLIHINPDHREKVFSVVERSASKYILFNENYSQRPRTLTYRKRNDLLYTCDFAQEFIKTYKDWKIIDNGIYYKHKRLFNFLASNKDIKWFLLERKNAI